MPVQQQQFEKTRTVEEQRLDIILLVEWLIGEWKYGFKGDEGFTFKMHIVNGVSHLHARGLIDMREPDICAWADPEQIEVFRRFGRTHVKIRSAIM